jgi:cytochrome bd-type quinol oxidase subunit 2
MATAAASSTAVGTAALASSTAYAPPGPYIVAASAVPVFEVSMTLGLLAVITVILRFVARHKQRQHIGGDDYAIVVAVVFMIGFIICGGLRMYPRPFFFCRE